MYTDNIVQACDSHNSYKAWSPLHHNDHICYKTNKVGKNSCLSLLVMRQHHSYLLPWKYVVTGLTVGLYVHF